MYRNITYTPQALRQSPPKAPVFRGTTESMGLKKEFGGGWFCNPVSQIGEGTVYEGVGMA